MQNYYPHILAFTAVILALIIKSKFSNNYTIADYSNSDLKQYRLGSSILTGPELILYRVMRKHMHNDFIISPKVRLADFINVKKSNFKGSPKSTRPAFNRISSKHADYMICDLKGRPICWVELDDSSHNTKRAKKADRFKNDLAKAVGIPLYRIRTGENYNAAITSIKQSYL